MARITEDALRRVSGPIGRRYQKLREGIPRSDVVYTDDTGWRVSGDRAHLTIFDTDDATVFQSVLGIAMRPNSVVTK